MSNISKKSQKFPKKMSKISKKMSKISKKKSQKFFVKIKKITVQILGGVSRELRRPLILLSVLECIVSILWIYGIWLGGPLRLILIFSFPSALNAILGICFASSERQQTGFLFLISTFLLIFFDGEFKGNTCTFGNILNYNFKI